MQKIAALTTPIRAELAIAIQALGVAAMVAELASQLGRREDGLYYHLRALVQVGLVQVRSNAASTAQAHRQTHRLALELTTLDITSARCNQTIPMVRVGREKFSDAHELRRRTVVFVVVLSCYFSSLLVLSWRQGTCSGASKICSAAY